MRLPKFRYAVLTGLTVGFIIPVALMTGFYLRILSAGEWLFLVWPASIMLMATENLGRNPEALGIVATSIAYNLVLYAILFSVLWCIAWVLRAGMASLRDGTTI